MYFNPRRIVLSINLALEIIQEIMRFLVKSNNYFLKVENFLTFITLHLNQLKFVLNCILIKLKRKFNN